MRNFTPKLDVTIAAAFLIIVIVSPGSLSQWVHSPTPVLQQNPKHFSEKDVTLVAHLQGLSVKNITVGSGPAGLALDTATGFLYVANSGTNNVSLINTTTNMVSGSISVGPSPMGVAFDSSNGQIYVANHGGNTVTVINGSSDSITTTITVGTYPAGVVFDDINGYIYVANKGSATVSVIDTTSESVITTVNTGTYPFGLAVDSFDNSIYVPNLATNDVTVINGSTNSVVDSIPVGAWPDQVAYDTVNQYLYSSNQNSNNVTIISTATDTAIGSIEGQPGARGVTFDPDNDYVYVANDNSNNISIINATSDTIVGSVQVGLNPFWIAIDSGNKDVYVTNAGTDTVSMVGTQALLSVKTSPSSATLLVNGSVLLSGIPACWSGSCPNTVNYAWSSTNSLGTLTSPTSSTTAFTAGSNSGNVSVFVNATLNGVTKQSAPIKITIVPNLVTRSFRASPNPVVVDHPTYLNLSATGGIGTQSYSYSGLPKGCVSANLSLLACTPSVNGSFIVRAYVNDSKGDSATITLTLTVSPAIPPLTISAFLAYPSTVNVAHVSYLNVTATGGVLPYAYSYVGLPQGCNSANQSSLQCVPTSSGSYMIKVNVADSSGESANDSTPLTVNPINSVLTISSFTASPSTVPLGGTTFLNVSVTGGTQPYSYVYNNLPNGCTSANSTSLPCSPLLAATYTGITVTVTDHAGNTALSSPLSFSVTPASGGPSIASFGASHSWFYIGGSTYLNVSATGGTLPYTYVYTNLPIGCASSNTSALECLPTASGIYASVTVTVTDSKAAGATSAPLTITVYSFPAIEAFFASPATIPLGGTTYLNVSAVGGETPYSYAYDGLPSGCPSANSSQLACVPTFAGVYQAVVVVTDHHGKTSTTQVSFKVSSLWGSINIQAFTAAPDSIPLGNTTTLTVLASGGSGVYTYSYTSLPPGCVTENVSALSCTPTSQGTFSIGVRVTDTRGNITMGTVLLVVTPAAQKVSHSPSGAFPWLYLILAVVVALLVALLLVFVFRRRKQSKDTNESEDSAEPLPPSQWPQKGLIPPAPPGYLEGVTFHRPTPEWAEEDDISYGTYPITEPADQEGTGATRSYPTSRAQPNAYVPWVIRIEPDGIKVDRQSGGPGISQKVRGASVPPTPTGGNVGGEMVLTPDTAQRILQSLSQRPMTINAIRENVTIPRDLLLGVIGAMSAAKLVSQGVNNRTGETVYVVTPSGRKLSNLRSSGQGAGKPAPTPLPEQLDPRRTSVPPARKSSGAKNPTMPLKKPRPAPKSTTSMPSEDPEDDFERGTAVSEAIRNSIKKAEDGVTVGDLKTQLISLDVSAAELYSRLATMEAEGRVHAVRGKTIDETRLYHALPSAAEPSADDRVHVDDSLLQSLKTEMEERDDHDSGERAGGNPESPPPDGTPAGGNVELERVIGEERTEDSPFGPGLKPEEVNPNVQHLDPRLLQPMEMRVSKDRGADTRDTSSPADADARAKALMEKAQKEREKMRRRRDRYGVEQAERPANGDHK